MRVLLVNTSDNIGGAAVACKRLMDALTLAGVEVRMLVRDKATDDSRVVSVGAMWKKAVERIMLLPFVGLSWRRSWTIDANLLGTDITKTEPFQWADVIHLHWVNQGFLSLHDIEKVARSGKKVVWTLHDLWPLESLYHYTSNTDVKEKGGMLSWLERQTMKRKQKAYGDANVSFVACSRWLKNQVADSELLQGNSICSVPNPIDTKVFFRNDKLKARQSLGLPADKKIILFVSQKLTDERKGARFFIEAVNRMQGVEVAVLGGHGEDIAAALHCRTHVLGYVSNQDEIAKVYNAADVFVLPSLNDNLPNTIMEAMACGVPCVGFSIGGIPEMIDHLLNGYVAPPCNVELLQKGIDYCLSEENSQQLSDACLDKVAKTYSQTSVANRFMAIYSDTFFTYLKNNIYTQI